MLQNCTFIYQTIYKEITTKNNQVYHIQTEFCACTTHSIIIFRWPNAQEQIRILTPFRRTQNLTREMIRYNTVHSSIRMHIEQAFGMLKGRFRRLKFIDQGSTERICYTICTACVLHNICIWQNDFDEIELDNNVPVAYLHGNLFNRKCTIYRATKTKSNYATVVVSSSEHCSQRRRFPAFHGIARFSPPPFSCSVP